MKSLAGGIDVGSEQHHVVIMNDKDQVLYDRQIAHKFSEFQKAIADFRKIGEREKVTIAFAMEGKNGYGSPFDRILVENGVTLYNVDNLKLERFKDVFGAEWRNVPEGREDVSQDAEVKGAFRHRKRKGIH